ncbi:MAG: TolC family protein [Alphaproteobacteria bacterium]|nr:TolC family protein [Alphaproteobacteria bacterium]
MKSRQKTAACIALMLFLAGCATSNPPPAEKEIRSYQEFTSRRLDDPEVKDFIDRLAPNHSTSWPPDKWQFDQLYLAALYFQPDLDVARSQWQTTKAGEITADEIPNPSVSLSPTHDQNNVLSGVSPWLYPLNLSIPIELGGKRELRVQNAKNLSNAAQLRIATTAWDVRARLQQAFIDAYASNLSMQLIRQQTEAQKAVIDIFNQRHAAGQGFGLSESQQQIAYRQTLLALKDAETQQAEAHAALASAIGIPLEAVESIRLDWSGLTEAKNLLLPPDFKEQSLKHHSQLAAALADYIAAHSALQIEIAKQIPDINLGPGYEWNPAGDKYILGFSITLPVFNNNEGAIAEAEARRKEAAEKFNALQAKVIGDIDLAVTHYKAALDKQTTADRLLAAQTATQKNLAAHLGQGEVAKIPLLLAQTETSAAKLAFHEAHIQVIKARAEIEAASEYVLSGTPPDAGLTEQPVIRKKP